MYFRRTRIRILLFGWKKDETTVFAKSMHNGRPVLYQSSFPKEELGITGQRSEVEAALKDVLGQRENIRTGLNKLGEAIN